MKIGIIGGGIIGLTVANQLIKKTGHKVYLFEARESLGGLAASLEEKNWNWPLEGFFHHFFTSDQDFKELLTELGIAEKLKYQRVKSSVYSHRQIYPFDSPQDFLKFPHLGFFDKLRMGSVLFLLRQLPYFKSFEKFPASEIFPKLIGEKAWSGVWKQLMDSKFADFSEQISFSWLWSRIKVRSAQLGYLNGGTKQVFDLLAGRIKGSNQIFLDSPVLKISRLGNSWKLESQTKKVVVDKVILAVPLPKALKLIAGAVPKEKLETLEKFKTIGALNLVLRTKRPFLPQKTYWLNVLDNNFPFVAVVDHTNFVDSSNYNNEHIAYIGGYYLQDDPIFHLSKKAVFDKFSPYLKKISPEFKKYLIDTKIFSSLLAQPIIPVNYSTKRPSLELVPGSVFWATPNHIFPWDRGMNYSVRLAKELSLLV